MTAPPNTNTSSPLLNRPPCVAVVQASVSARATRSANTEYGITANKFNAMILQRVSTLGRIVARGLIPSTGAYKAMGGPVTGAVPPCGVPISPEASSARVQVAARASLTLTETMLRQGLVALLAELLAASTSQGLDSSSPERQPSTPTQSPGSHPQPGSATPPSISFMGSGSGPISPGGASPLTQKMSKVCGGEEGRRRGLCLKGRGGPSGQSQSGCRAVTGDGKAVGGRRFLAVGNAVEG